MARKIMVQEGDESKPVLMTETLAENEAQLQEILKANPDLLPVDEFGMSGPLMVVGRETSLSSGAVDLIGVSRDGNIIIVEFKTGPQNSDFRHVLAQLLDYGSDLWRMSYEVFESTVATRFFSSDRCHDELLRGKTSLIEAAIVIWPDLSAEETALLRDRLVQRLNSGEFHYVVVAQEFRDTMERTVEYLNATMRVARFYAVELVRFSAESLSAFESRTVLKPERRSSSTFSSEPKTSINEARFLEQIADDNYREALQYLLEVCRGLDLRFFWGTAGTSIRLPMPGGSQFRSVGWLFPPGVSGWMGLTDLTLGFDASYETIPPALENYVAEVSTLQGVETAKPTWLRGYRLDPETTVHHRHEIAELLARLVRQFGEEG